MANLNVDQKTVKDLFQDKKSDFLIPDYQRPYAWTDTHCQKLWDDVFEFAFPGKDYSKFDNTEYYLGPIVTFFNQDRGKIEVIDGQQRLTTLMLLLRAFYTNFSHMEDSESKTTRKNIEMCIWKTDEFEKPFQDALKIDSEVATDEDKDQFLQILKDGEAKPEQKSLYANNYRFFQKKINEFMNEFPSYFAYLPNRIMKNCILLPIKAESKDDALRIFSTLNDRGLPLSDSDIFKAQLYKYYVGRSKKDVFIKEWKELEKLCKHVFQPQSGSPIDEIFTQYMYFKRAEKEIKKTTTEALRKFYEQDRYALLNQEITLDNLINLAKFWQDITKQDPYRFSDRIRRKLFVLNYAPNGMWTYFTSVYYMANKDEEGKLEEENFYCFLHKITAFIWAYAMTNPGVNNMRTPAYAEFVNIVHGKKVTFSDFKFRESEFKNTIDNYTFSNNRPITKSMLVWWAFQNEQQKDIPSLKTNFEIEHIYATSREKNDKALRNVSNLEVLGNKALLEESINIRASDYRFEDKKKYYLGFETRDSKIKPPTVIYELRHLADTKDDFNESDIETRNQAIFDAFIEYLRENELIAE
jgi:uncharacterized protein with ParB-like and HNH nuclease domain